ncbi:DUF1016 N-terminal domain-containing protein [Nocardioides sp. T5]|uniref:DUF1016 N-terminal domain-containing protein n=1 Tax=Nocardioides sp. T5 TaxID=3400182 RepID=UPI003A84F91A
MNAGEPTSHAGQASEGGQPYPDALAGLAAEVRAAQLRARVAANAEMLRLYWTIGRTVLAQQVGGYDGGHGDASIVETVAADLRAAFPGMRTLTQSNVEAMRRFAAAYPPHDDGTPAPLPGGGALTWGHVRVLLEELDDRPTRDWYADRAVKHGWSQNVLAHHIRSGLHARPRVIVDDLADTALVISRSAADMGHRTDLDDVITMFGYTRTDLEAELAAELGADETDG